VDATDKDSQLQLEPQRGTNCLLFGQNVKSQFGEGVFVVSVTAVEMLRQGKVRFTGVGPQTQGGLGSAGVGV